MRSKPVDFHFEKMEEKSEFLPKEIEAALAAGSCIASVKKNGYLMMFVGYLTYWPYLPLLFLPKKGVKMKKELFFQKNLPDFIDKTINQASPI